MGFLGDWFPAVLQDEKGEELSAGSACFDKEKQEIEFSSDFVPLFPLGTVMKIERLYNGAVVHDFQGQVYLSSKSLMRLVGVEDQIYYGAQYVYCTGLNLGATIELLNQKPQKKPLLFFAHKAEKRKESTAVTVSAVDLDGMTILYDILDPLERGDQLLLRLNDPLPLFEAKLRVEDQLLFGSRASYYCRYAQITAGNLDDLGHYIFEHCPMTY